MGRGVDPDEVVADRPERTHEALRCSVDLNRWSTRSRLRVEFSAGLFNPLVPPVLGIR